jgi:hypothetical protein
MNEAAPITEARTQHGLSEIKFLVPESKLEHEMKFDERESLRIAAGCICNPANLHKRILASITVQKVPKPGVGFFIRSLSLP